MRQPSGHLCSIRWESGVSRLCLLSCSAWWKTKQMVHRSSLGEEETQHHSFGNDVCFNKGKSCFFWVLVCLVWSTAVKEQGARQSPTMRALFTSYSLGKKHSMLREVSCAKTYYSIAGLTEILCKQSVQWAWDSGPIEKPCSGFPAGENNVKKMKTNLFHCCMEMRRGLPLILKEPCALPMPRPGITSKALLSGTGSITCLHKSVSYTYCIKI